MLHRTRNGRGVSRRLRRVGTVGSALGALALSLPGAGHAEKAAADSVARSDASPLSTLESAYYREWAKAHPGDATALGIHDHDGELEDISAAGQAAELARLRGWQARLASIPHGGLTMNDRIDLELLDHAVASQLLRLVELQPLHRWPGQVLDTSTNAIYVLIKRDFAPAVERLRSVIARERSIPDQLKTALGLLDGASREATATALSEVADMRSFFANDVPAAFIEVHDAPLLADLQRTTALVDSALVRYERALRSQILPHAKAPIGLGEPLYRRLLMAEDWVDSPIEPLLAQGQAELERLQRAFTQTAHAIDPNHSVADVQHSIQADHAPAGGILAETRARLNGLREFIVAHDLVGIPAEGQPVVQESPPFMRATTLASMESAGVLETHSTQAFYNITLPDPKWKKGKADEYLGGALNRRLLDSTSIHEVFPGHYLQDLWQRRNPSLVRRIEGPNTFVEGWAHYCEQMMLDEGYGEGDARLRLAQLQDALLRAARFVVALRVHTRGMTFAEAVTFFEREGLQSRSVAESEARRAVTDPLYLYYTLGKLQILKLRDDYRARLGAHFTMRKFHDAMLSAGALPSALLRELLLP